MTEVAFDLLFFLWRLRFHRALAIHPKQKQNRLWWGKWKLAGRCSLYHRCAGSPPGVAAGGDQWLHKITSKFAYKPRQ